MYIQTAKRWHFSWILLHKNTQLLILFWLFISLMSMSWLRISKFAMLWIELCRDLVVTMTGNITYVKQVQLLQEKASLTKQSSHVLLLRPVNQYLQETNAYSFRYKHCSTEDCWFVNAEIFCEGNLILKHDKIFGSPAVKLLRPPAW